MLDWLTLRDPYIGGWGYNVFMWSGFAVWIWMTVRHLEVRRDFWLLFKIVFFSFVGAIFIPLSILLVQVSLKGQLVIYFASVSRSFEGILSPAGAINFFKVAFKGFSLTAGVLSLSIILGFIWKPGRRFLFPFLYPFPLFSSIIRLGCFSDGCCYGRETSFMGVTYPGGSYASLLHYRRGHIVSRYAESMPVHPVQLYMSLSMLILFIVLVIMKRRGVARDIIAGTSLVGYGVANFFLEFLRQDVTVLLGLTPSQIIHFGIVAIGIWLIRSARREAGGSSGPDTPDTTA